MYNIVVKARTELNVSKPLRGTIGFSDTFTWIDVPVLLGNKVNSIDFSTDGSVMILGREGNDCDIWNTDSWSLIQSVKGNISDESANVVDAVLAHDNPWLALGVDAEGTYAHPSRNTHRHHGPVLVNDEGCPTTSGSC